MTVRRRKMRRMTNVTNLNWQWFGVFKIWHSCLGSRLHLNAPACKRVNSSSHPVEVLS